MSHSSSVQPNNVDKNLTPGSDSVLPADINGNNCNGGQSTNSQIKKRRKRVAIKTFRDLYEETGEFLGRGTFGSVETYKNKVSGKEFAVKIIKSTSKNRKKVFKEIEIFHQCKGNENILNLVEYFEENDLLYLVFDKMEGGTLFTHINKRDCLREKEAVLVVRQIATAIEFLHKKGIAHRDLKPENILCSKSDDVVPVKITDFDLASGVKCAQNNSDDANPPKLFYPVGTPDYMAPEVVDVWVGEALCYDRRCDLWSLGVILYEMLCGYQPFCGECDEDCDEKYCDDCDDLLYHSIQDGEFEFDEEDWNCVSDSAKDLIRQLLVKDPDERYSAADVLKHPWVVVPSSPTLTHTPSINNTTNHLEPINTMLQQHLVISEAPSCLVGNQQEVDKDISGNNNDTQSDPSMLLQPTSSLSSLSALEATSPSSLSSSSSL